MKRSLLVALALVAAATPANIRAEEAFVSATVKAHADAAVGGGMRLQPGGGFSATGVTLHALVAFAYQRHPFDRREVAGGPAWSDSDRYDVSATAAVEPVLDADGAPRKTWSMLRTLLAARFRLQVREEPRPRPVYALTVASAGRLGPRLRRTDADCAAAMKAGPSAAGGPPPCSLKTPPGRLFANTVTMATLASLLSQHLDRVVVDETGLAGRFDIELEAAEIKAPPGYQPGPSDVGLPPAAGHPMLQAVQEQLGLKLEPRTAPLPVIVIEQAEKPTPD